MHRKKKYGRRIVNDNIGIKQDSNVVEYIHRYSIKTGKEQEVPVNLGHH